LSGGAPDASGGSITLSSLTTERVTGSMALRFENGQLPARSSSSSPPTSSSRSSRPSSLPPRSPSP